MKSNKTNKGEQYDRFYNEGINDWVFMLYGDIHLYCIQIRNT